MVGHKTCTMAKHSHHSLCSALRARSLSLSFLKTHTSNNTHTDNTTMITVLTGSLWSRTNPQTARG